MKSSKKDLAKLEQLLHYFHFTLKEPVADMGPNKRALLQRNVAVTAANAFITPRTKNETLEEALLNATECFLRRSVII